MVRDTAFIITLFFSLILIAKAPGQARIKNGFNLEASSIPPEEIRNGGPPRDGIPSIDDPHFVEAKSATYPLDSDRVLGIVIDGLAKAYPIGIMNYHEIVNDHFDSTAVVITYCPLCGSGIAFQSNIQGTNRTFGVSGLLYNSDVLLYDRESESLWSQLMNEAITGPLKGTTLEIIPTANTTWKDWKDLYPETKVLTTQTGHFRDYTSTPYTGYDESEKTYFPVNNSSNLYHSKDWVTVVTVNGQSKAYPFEELKKAKSTIIDKIGEVSFKVYFDKKNQSARVVDSKNKELPYYNTFWFAWYAFHPDGEVYKSK